MPDESILHTIEDTNSADDADARLLISPHVEYHYSNYAEVSWSNTELRIAFGDDVPGAGIRPRTGVVLLLPYAQLLQDKLQEALEFFIAQQGRPAAED